MNFPYRDQRLTAPQRHLRKTPRKIEFQMQCALIQWLAYEIKNYPELKWLYAIPNGGKRHVVVAAQMKAMGVKAGVWDLCLPVPHGKFHGLYVEMKSDDGDLTPAQRDFGDFIASVGYAVMVCRSADEARDSILRYINLGAFNQENPA